MSEAVRIGNAYGFWGDRLDAAGEMLALDPDLDYLTLDFLAEVSMSVLALQRSRDPVAGWPRDFLEIVGSIAPYWRGGGRCRIITNAGGLNPMGCARACREVLENGGCSGRTIAVVAGDDVMDIIRGEQPNGELLRNLDTGESIETVRDRLVTANAYLGARPIVEALQRGADLVITGRVADPSLTVAACVHAFGWAWDDLDRLAGATVAGHLIECGTQVTGGIATDWLDVPNVARIGFPIVEVADDGSCLVRKPQSTGGRVCESVVKEQLVYEIGDPDAYLSPDVVVSLLSLHVEDQGEDRVGIRGARGRPAPSTYKVSATYQDGFRAQGLLTVYGDRCVAKARRAAQSVLDRLRASGVSFRESLIECVGAGASRPQGEDPVVAEQLKETVLRLAVADDSREAVERFSRQWMPLVTAGPQGTTGYAEGRPRIHPMYRFWPCLIERDRVQQDVALLQAEALTPAGVAGDEDTSERPWIHHEPAVACEPSPAGHGYSRRLGAIAHARSGDKGIHANIGVVARRPEDYDRLCREVTADRVASYLGLVDADRVVRYTMPNLGALNFVIRGVLADPLRIDAQGKALGQVLLEMPLETAERT